MRYDRRVVITGMGIISPIGIGKNNFWNALLEGNSAAKIISSFDASTYPTRVAGEILDFDPTDFMSHKEARRMDRSSQLILAAGSMALEDSGIKLNSHLSRVGVFTGTAIGGQAWAFREYEVFREKGLKRINPFTANCTYPNATSAQLSSRFGCKGSSDTISSGCVSSTVALGYALDSLRMGRLDVAIVGGTEAPIDPGIFGAYCAAGVMTRGIEKVPRPFDSRRDGILLSEGSAVLTCETLHHASNRNAKIYAELAGWSHNADSYSMMMLNPDGCQAQAVMLEAIEDSGLTVDQIDYVQPHASGTVADDRTEARALRNVFGERTDKIPVVPLKSMFGHTQGACGAIEAATAALSIHNKVIPAAINCDSQDPLCSLWINHHCPLNLSARAVLINTFGFGGKNASVILRAFSQ